MTLEDQVQNYEDHNRQSEAAKNELHRVIAARDGEESPAREMRLNRGQIGQN